MQKVILDLRPGGVAPIVYASQYDDERSIRFMLTEGGPDNQYILNSSEVITCNLTKPDGTETVINVANPGGGECYVDLVNGADDYDQAGAYLGEIVLTRNTKVIGSANFVLKVEEDAYDGQITTASATGNPCTFTTDLADNLVSLTAEIVASGGNGTPSTPIPINGYTEANITRCGVNLFDKNAFVNTYSSNFSIESDGSIYSSNYTSVLNNTIWENVTGKSGSFTITFISKYSTSGGSVGLRPRVIYKDGTSDTIQPTNTQTYLTTTFTSSASKTVDKIVVDYGSSTYPTYFYLQIEAGSTANAYQDYNGQTYTIAFGQTVYGGVLDVTRGKLHVTWGFDDLGSLNWNDYPSDSKIFYNTANIGSAIKTDNQIVLSISNKYITGISLNTFFDIKPDKTISIGGSNGRVYLKDIDFDGYNGTQVKSALSGTYLAYELATPFDIDLTPVQISALVGTNNITSDLGGDVSVTYIKKVSRT